MLFKLAITTVEDLEDQRLWEFEWCCSVSILELINSKRNGMLIFADPLLFIESTPISLEIFSCRKHAFSFSLEDIRSN